MTTQILDNSISFLKEMIQKGGPRQEDYSSFEGMLDDLSLAIAAKKVSKKDLQRIYGLFDENFMEKSIHGHSFRKPFGYAGDFMVIDKVYQIDIEPAYENWDKYVFTHRTCDGIRNRKAYFKQKLSEICTDARTPKIELLNVASGPARDLQELYVEHKVATKKLYTHCIDHDPRAIEYATKLTNEFNEQITYEQGNIYKYHTDRKFDVIWSSGLFDYFNDKVFVQILKKFIEWGKPQSEIILGNICSSHSLKNYMEILWEWPLQIRSAKDLIRLAQEAGIDQRNIKIGIEETGTFLFLHVYKG